MNYVDLTILRSITYSQRRADEEYQSPLPINTFSDISLYPRYPMTHSREDEDLRHMSHLMNNLRYGKVEALFLSSSGSDLNILS